MNSSGPKINNHNSNPVPPNVWGQSISQSLNQQAPVSGVAHQISGLNQWVSTPQASPRRPKWVRLKSHDELIATGWSAKMVGGILRSYEHRAVPVSLTGEMLARGTGLHNWNDFTLYGSIWKLNNNTYLDSFDWHEKMFTSLNGTPQYDAYTIPSISSTHCANCAHVYVNVSFMHCKMACKHCGIDQPASLAPSKSEDLWP